MDGKIVLSVAQFTHADRLELSEKQKKSLDIAIKNGYYAFPRKINLNQLAKIARISKQSFQESLCRAENKLIPYLTS